MSSRLISLLLVFALVFPSFGTPLSRAEDPDLSSFVEQTALILQMKQKVAALQYRYTSFSDNFEHAQKNLEETNAALANLDQVLADLDAQIADTQRQMTNVKSQEEQTVMDTQQTQDDIASLQGQLAAQKLIVGRLMRILYFKRDVYSDGKALNTVALLAGPETVSETLQELSTMKLLQDQNRLHLQAIADLSSRLSSRWEELRTKQGQLSASDLRLIADLDRLQKERDNQQAIWDETNSEKNILESMLLSKDGREEDLTQEIEIYQHNIETLQAKLSDANALLTEDQKATLAKIQTDMEGQFAVDEAARGLTLEWPISPSGGLTAFFHDGGYQATFGVDHYALDIRTKQGTEIHSPADGVVQAVIYNPDSTRYAYIMVAHRMGVSTLYGHISAAAVEVGDFVNRGQLLGYTGGAPGSVGSGGRTTGSHLHFEVWQDGVRTDPLSYLPLDQLDMKSLPTEQIPIIQAALERQLFKKKP